MMTFNQKDSTIEIIVNQSFVFFFEISIMS